MLINDLSTLKAIIPTIIGNDFDRYRPWLDGADRWLIREITGQILFDKLDDAGNETILGYARRVSAFRAYLDAIPFLDLVDTENGFGIVSNDHVAPASRERVQALIAQTDKAFTQACDDLFRYLEQTVAYHTDWKQSNAYSLASNCYIYSLEEFQNYAPFAGSRLDFIKVKPIMLKIQKLKIEPVISRELSAEIITQLRSSGGLNAANTLIIDLLRFALAFMTIDDVEYRRLLIPNPYELKADQSIEKDNNGQSFLLQARKIIIANLDSYPTFKTSALYAEILANARSFSSEDPFMVAGA